MSQPPQEKCGSWWPTVGVFVFAIFCGFPAEELSGHGFGIPFSMFGAVVCAVAGGAVAGLLFCPRPMLAGLVGGVIAGPCELFLLYCFSQGPEKLGFSLRLYLSLLGGLPGLGIGWLLYKALSADSLAKQPIIVTPKIDPLPEQTPVRENPSEGWWPMSVEHSFLTAILSNPHDDTPRLVFADWLEERDGPGDAARAEFIRLSVGAPDITFWAPSFPSGRELTQFHSERGLALCREHWHEWTELLRQRLDSSPLRRWLDSPACRWGYRRGFVAVFEGNQQVVLDAWDDLFQIGPLEEVAVNNLWHLGTVPALSQFLNRPSLRILRLRADELRDDDVEQLNRVSDWLARFERVELMAYNSSPSAAHRLTEWLASDESMRNVRWQRR
jgi:uncharacterized protein (TIGR02996 family)